MITIQRMLPPFIWFFLSAERLLSVQFFPWSTYLLSELGYKIHSCLKIHLILISSRPYTTAAVFDKDSARNTGCIITVSIQMIENALDIMFSSYRLLFELIKHFLFISSVRQLK
ncbi:hypothetical protein BD770DRAFT_425171 [Pilaira anomala]|nr:hypothetical protein BD770DRAFT_425171 [Pilaira anomala]